MPNNRNRPPYTPKLNKKPLKPKDLGEQVSVLEFLADDIEASIRVDNYLHNRAPYHSRAFYQRMVTEGRVFINGCLAKKSSIKAKPGDLVLFHLPPELINDVAPKDIPLEIIFQDEHLVVLNKTPGFVVHPSGVHLSDTILNALHAKFKGQLKDDFPKIAHRIDKETSGVLVYSLSVQAVRELYFNFFDRKAKKIYLALVDGIPDFEEIEVTQPLKPTRDEVIKRSRVIVADNGKPSQTQFSVKKIFKEQNMTLIEARPRTGRMHQIRVHLQYLGLPIVDDPMYNPIQIKRVGRCCLHAYSLEMPHPVTGEKLLLKADLYADIAEYISKLK
jgi:23S rRNA pseudouridine1911/1915/1917 synthase